MSAEDDDADVRKLLEEGARLGPLTPVISYNILCEAGCGRTLYREGWGAPTAALALAEARAQGWIVKDGIEACSEFCFARVKSGIK